MAFRDYLKEKGISKTEEELHMQEIYNRYFFFRKEEINKPDMRDKKGRMRWSPPRKTRNDKASGLSRSMMNFEDLKSRDSLKKMSKESMVSSPLDHH